MHTELMNCISNNELSPFSPARTILKQNIQKICKTPDARAVHTRILEDISKHFAFKETSNLLSCFPLTTNINEIKFRQDYFNAINPEITNSFLKGLKKDKKNWRPKYGILVVTEDDSDFVELQKRGCPVKLLLNDTDVQMLEDADIIQVVSCDNYRPALERLPQTVFLRSIDEAYLERYVELLSEWKSILKLLNESNVEPKLKGYVNELIPLLQLLEPKKATHISRERVDEAIAQIKNDISASISAVMVSGSSLIEMISKGGIPEELKSIVKDAIRKTQLPLELFTPTMPVTIDEHELSSIMRKQSANEFTGIAEEIRSKASVLKKLPSTLKQIEHEILLHDFNAGIVSWMRDKNTFPVVSEEFSMKGSINLFLKNPQPITFHLTPKERCSILTGANSGGKTTLLEHMLQVLFCTEMGLRVTGAVTSPLFSEVYYFAKNKGSMSKGAFETLLTQMASIIPTSNTLLLADEIESVTEPGVAGKMICATADYFIQKGCFIVIATHLGHVIQKNLPFKARIDGIEAKGLSEDNELIVDHNPVLGVLAHSTPELIIERLVKVQGGEYVSFLHNAMKGITSNIINVEKNI